MLTSLNENIKTNENNSFLSNEFEYLEEKNLSNEKSLAEEFIEIDYANINYEQSNNNYQSSQLDNFYNHEDLNATHRSLFKKMVINYW